MSNYGNYKVRPMKIKETNLLLDYTDFVDFSPLFIETGSCNGEGIQRALDAGFHRVKSVEAMPEYYNQSSDRFKGNLFVQCYFGSSFEKLPEMIERLNFPAVFFLDAHPAGPGTAGHVEILAGKSDYGQNYIITRELEVILSHMPDHLIIIDDLSIGSDEDANYMQICLDANPNYTFEYYDEEMSEYRKNKVLVCRP